MSSDTISGMQFGQYTLRDLIGVGGMGAVYLADQPGLKRQVAVKVLNGSAASDPTYHERFAREAQMAARLEHPHIVPVYDHGITPDGISYVVMRLLNGGSLGQRLEQLKRQGKGQPSLNETTTLLRQMANALDYAHSKGVIHRDIKPNNIMFDEQGNSYLVDFGIARAAAEQSSASMTQTGMMVGTPAYMPPEVWRGEDWTKAADQYALGIVVYEMVNGRPPFAADTIYQLISQHLNAEPPAPSSEDVPETIIPVLLRALSKDPNERYPTVSAFADEFDEAVKTANLRQKTTGFFQMPLDLEGQTKFINTTPRNLLLTGVGMTSVGTPLPAPKRDNRLLIAAGVVALLVVIISAFVAFQSNTQQNNFQATLVALQATQAADQLFVADDMLTATAVTCVAAIAPGVDDGSGEVAFQSDRDGDTNLYLMNADGSSVRQLTDSPGEDLAPLWSPDGSKIAYISDQDGNNEIYLLISSADAPDTFTAMRLTTNEVDDAEPAWSPDGQKVAFSSRLNGNWDIYVVNVDGSGLTRLTDDQGADQVPTWSADGTRIAFTSDRNGNGEIYVMDANGSNLRRLTESEADDGTNVAWSPDGTRIAFVSIQPDGNWEVYTVNPDEADSVMDFSGRRGDEWQPRWSTDGKTLGYLWQTDNVDIVLTGADGSQRRNITSASSDDYTIAWSPNSQQLAFETDRDGNWEIYSVDACGGGLRRLTNNSSDDENPAWRPSGG